LANRQRNKGESVHSLKAHLIAANQGVLDRKTDEGLQHQVRCLNLLTKAIILWNSVYMAEALQQLEREGFPFDREDLRISGLPTLSISTSMADTNSTLKKRVTEMVFENYAAQMQSIFNIAFFARSIERPFPRAAPLGANVVSPSPAALVSCLSPPR
jgi:hypothetical protein